MMTLLEAVSLCGDRSKQNDDACLWGPTRAAVIDGATDLHDAPHSGARSDAAWLAQFIAQNLDQHGDAVDRLREVSTLAAREWARLPNAPQAEAWALPTAALLVATEVEDGVEIVDLGDCAAFLLDADAQCARIGGPLVNREAEQALAAAHNAGAGADLRSPQALATLRAARSMQNRADGYAIFGLQPHCAARARRRLLSVRKPAWLLLATDGLAALSDSYRRYDPPELMRRALEVGLVGLAQELRAIEQDDPAGALHPRWKKSDDATGLLLRLD